MISRRATLLLAATILALLIGCGGSRREDVKAIRAVYAEFRMELIKQNYDAATNYLSSDLLASYPDHRKMLVDFFWAYTNAYHELNDNSRVEFRRLNESEAFLFPHEAPATGQGFVKQTNGWKITANVITLVPD